MEPFDPSLENYLEWVLARPWRWGETDCCHFGARWAERRTGRPVLDGPGRAYATARGALELVRARGGMLPMVRGYLEPAGLLPTLAPEHGDIGLVRLPRGPLSLTGEALVIRCATRWIGRALDGVTQVREEPYACWHFV